MVYKIMHGMERVDEAISHLWVKGQGRIYEGPFLGYCPQILSTPTKTPLPITPPPSSVFKGLFTGSIGSAVPTSCFCVLFPVQDSCCALLLSHPCLPPSCYCCCCIVPPAGVPRGCMWDVGLGRATRSTVWCSWAACLVAAAVSWRHLGHRVWQTQDPGRTLHQ